MVLTAIKHCVKLLEPLGLLWLALLAVGIWLRRRGQRGPAIAVHGLWMFLSAATCLPLGDRLLAHLESPWRDTASTLDGLRPADAIVCLGGGIEPSQQELIGLNMQESSDRPTTAIELMRRGKAPLLIFSGGAHPRSTTSEAGALKQWVEHWNLVAAKVETLRVCKDTHDEAEAIAALARERGWKSLILVTSATHMRRAAAVFAKSTSLDIRPAPCAFATRAELTEWVHLPDYGDIQSFSTWFHETIGWWTYRLRGWI